MSSIERQSSLLHMQIPSSAQPISQASVLRLLNDAVWAPNDEHREPWRFIYLEGPSALPEETGPAEAVLLVVAPLSSDPVKRVEDFAACCCLAENFRLLSLELGWRVIRSLEPWTRELNRLRELGVGEKERIAAVLKLLPLQVVAQQDYEAKSLDFEVF